MNPVGVTQRIDLDEYDMAKKRRIEDRKEGEKRKSEEPNQEKITEFAIKCGIRVDENKFDEISDSLNRK